MNTKKIYEIDIIADVTAQDWPLGQFAVFGSGLLQMLKLRESKDIDIVATTALYEQLKNANGWTEEIKPTGRCLQRGHFEIYDVWDLDTYRRTPEMLIAMAELVSGVPFVPLPEVRLFKAAMGRPKDLADIACIDTYLVQRLPN